MYPSVDCWEISAKYDVEDEFNIQHIMESINDERENKRKFVTNGGDNETKAFWQCFLKQFSKKNLKWFFCKYSFQLL